MKRRCLPRNIQRRPIQSWPWWGTSGFNFYNCLPRSKQRHAPLLRHPLAFRLPDASELFRSIGQAILGHPLIVSAPIDCSQMSTDWTKPVDAEFLSEEGEEDPCPKIQ